MSPLDAAVTGCSYNRAYVEICTYIVQVYRYQSPTDVGHCSNSPVRTARNDDQKRRAASLCESSYEEDSAMIFSAAKLPSVPGSFHCSSGSFHCICLSRAARRGR